MRKNYIFLAILGSVWGIVELQLGTLLHSTTLPFVGLVMMALGIFFQTTARYVTRMRGSALLVAVVVSFLKLLFIGGIAFSTVFAIFVQSGILEFIYAKREPSRLRMSFAGAVSVSYALVHPFFSMPVFMGLTVFDAYDRITRAGSLLFALPNESGLIILALLLFVHLSMGFAAGILTFNAMKRMRRLGFIRLSGRNE